MVNLNALSAVLAIGVTSFYAIQLSSAGRAIDLDIFKSIGTNTLGYKLINTAKLMKNKKVVRAKAESVDLCFLIDITGSMQPYIEAVKDSIRDTVNALTRKLGGHGAKVKKLRVSLVGYRDHVDRNKIQLLPFTTNVPNFLRQVSSIRATGGGDAPEDVYTGLQTLTNQRWTAQKRIILHMADAPCHGTGCGGGTKDPKGRNPEDIFREVRVKKLFYTFGRIRPTTNTMINMFAQAYGRNIPLFDVSWRASTRSGISSRGHGKWAKKVSIGGGISRKAVLKKKVGDASLGAVLLGISD